MAIAAISLDVLWAVYGFRFNAPPANVIGGSILVFRGRFDFRLGSAMSHVRVAQELVAAGNLAQGLVVARTAALIEPNSLEAHEFLGDLLARQNNPDEAHREFDTALSFVQQLPLRFRKPLIASITKKMAGLRRPGEKTCEAL